MPRAEPVLVAVRPDLLGLLLAEILERRGERRVVNASSHPLSPPRQRYAVALVSDPLPDYSLAEVVITVPAPGQSMGEVRYRDETHAVRIAGAQDLLDALDRYSPGEERSPEGE